MVRIILILVALTTVLGSCSKDDLRTISVNGRVISEVTGDPIANVPVIGLAQGVQGSGIFGFTYDIDRQTVQTNAEGFFVMSLGYEDYDRNFIRIFKDASDCCTEFLNIGGVHTLAELENRNLEVTVRKLYPITIKVKNVDPFDDNDSIYIHIIEVDPNNPYNRVFEVENFGVQNQPRDPNQTGIGDNLYWVGQNVDAILRSFVQEEAEMTLHYSVEKDGDLTSYETVPIPTVENGVTYYEILY